MTRDELGPTDDPASATDDVNIYDDNPAIILFTDGRNSSRFGDPLPIAIDLKNKDAMVFVVWMSDWDLDDPRHADAINDLQSLPGNGGYAAFVQSQSELNTTFSNIAAQVSCS